MAILFAAMLLLTFFACKKETADTIPDTPKVTQEGLTDGHFEDWQSITQGNATYYEPSSGWWTTLNKLTLLGGPSTVTFTSDSYEGIYAAKLTTLKWGTDFLVPGLLAAGYFDTEMVPGKNVIQGRPYTKKPEKLIGYFKYLSVNNDSAGFYANITHFNTTTGIRDTIAEAKLAIYQSVPAYTIFEIPFIYRTDTIIPDTLRVVFTSSAGGEYFIGHEGSTLYLDDVKLIIPAP